MNNQPRPIAIKNYFLFVLILINFSSCKVYKEVALNWKFRKEYKSAKANPINSYSKPKIPFDPSIGLEDSQDSVKLPVLVSKENFIVHHQYQNKVSQMKLKHFNNLPVIKSPKTELGNSNYQVEKQISKPKSIVVASNSQKYKSKYQSIAALLALFVGFLGMHRFYLEGDKNKSNGVMQLVLSLLVFTLPIAFVWAMVDFIRIILGKLKPGHSNYAKKKY